MKPGFLKAKQKHKRKPTASTSGSSRPVDPFEEALKKTQNEDGVHGFKLPTGDLGEAGVPVQLDKETLKRTEIREVRQGDLDGADPESIIMTTQPPDTRDPNGYTECIVSMRAKSIILAIPDFPHRVRRPALSHRISSCPEKEKGLGMFATRNIAKGQLIMSERPIVLAPAGLTMAMPGIIDNTLSFADQPKEKQAAYKALYNSHTKDGSGPLFGIFRTNGLAASGLEAPGTSNSPAQYHMHSAVCLEISRVNHSCIPNARWVFELRSMSYELVSIAKIAKDEEITFAYCSADLPLKERQEQLFAFGFQCSCSKCLSD